MQFRTLSLPWKVEFSYFQTPAMASFGVIDSQSSEKWKVLDSKFFNHWADQ